MNWLAASRAVFGIAALVAPDRFSGDIARTELTTQSRWAIRILGARQLLQAAVCARAPTRCVLELEAVVDGVHAATMAAVVVAARRRSTRRAAAANVVSAAGFLVVDLVGVRTLNPTGAHGSSVLAVRDRLAQAICRALPIVGE